jgi:tetratricopeptide (TPR) repeat protein
MGFVGKNLFYSDVNCSTMADLIMKKFFIYKSTFCFLFSVVAMGLMSLCGCSRQERVREYAGSESCRECHERFYQLWASSHHAKALQPWSAELAADVPEQLEPIEAEGLFYMAHITPERGWVTDSEGREYTIKYSLGGKNYYNFLTLMDDGRLQVLPIFYDVQHSKWRNTTLSMLRHFSDGQEDIPIGWRDPMLTFNAECFRCHVSQSESNYDPETDTYATVWKEPGISCEACHGPSSEHIRVCKAAPTNKPPENLEIIRWDEELTHEQQNSSCAGCHTKGGAITDSFDTGDDYWDHFDLTTFDHADYYPDGFDLGENYTMGSWFLSPCVTKGDLSCTYCHTSSGRYKFKAEEKANEACLTCHESRREDAASHMHHAGVENGANKCVDCHMAMHSFGGMNQSDHSMRPPMPNLSIATGSRNACVICHEDKSNEWALEHVREWHPTFDQDTALEMKRALLVKALREQDWTQLSAALDYIDDPASDPLFATSMIRLLPPSSDPRQYEILRRQAVENDHPLVRSAAAVALDADNNPADRPALFTAIADEKRLVRVRAAERLAALSDDQVPEEHRAALDAAMEEMWAAYRLRPDNWGSHYNAGNILMRQKSYMEAGAKFDRAHELRNDIAPPLINGAMAFANEGKLDEAEKRLLKAIDLPEPSAPAHFNLGLLYAEQGRMADAEKHLYKTIELDPRSAQAAYNLAVIKAGKDYPETFRLLNLAIKADPYNPRYVETLVFYYMQTRQADLARKAIEDAYRRGASSEQLQGMYQQLQGL